MGSGQLEEFSVASYYDLLRTVHINSASAATRPSTSALAEYFQIPIRSRSIVALSISWSPGLHRLLEARAINAYEIINRILVRFCVHGLERQDSRLPAPEPR